MNDWGQLGHGEINRWRDTPKLIHTLEGKNVKEISTNFCVACITADNTCYVWGDCERFGLGSEVAKLIKLERQMKSISISIIHFNNSIYPFHEKGVLFSMSVS